MKSIARSFLVILFAIAVSTNSERAAAQAQSMLCDGALALTVLFAPNGESVLLEFQGRIKVVLTEAVSASGARYTGGGYELHGKGTAWTLMRPGSGSVNCATASGSRPIQNAQPTPPPATIPTTLPGQAGVHIRFPHRARSFGGKVRSGPSMETRKTASLREGEAITLLENTGQRMGEHDWFKIRFRGRIGYHWGGIMCIDGIKAVGILSVCPHFKKAAPLPKTTTKRCRKGQYWSVSRKRCTWYAKKKKKTGCPPGTVWTNEGNFCQDKWAAYCGPGYHYNKGLKKCVQNP